MDIPKRKPTRCKYICYNKNGKYFITICTKDKEKLLAKIVGDVEGAVPYKREYRSAKDTAE